MSNTAQAVAFRALRAALDTTGSDAELIDEITALEAQDHDVRLQY